MVNGLVGMECLGVAFLFLGFSFSDPNINYILSRVRIAYDENQRMHHCILRTVQMGDCKDQAEFEYRKRKQEFFVQDLLGYGIQSFMIDEYHEITEILENLEKQYRRDTVFVSGAAHNYAPKGEEESHEFVAELSKAIIKNNFRVVSGFGLGIDAHGAEFHQDEGLAVESDALLGEQGRTRGSDAHDEVGGQHERPEKGQDDQRKENVHGALGELRPRVAPEAFPEDQVGRAHGRNRDASRDLLVDFFALAHVDTGEAAAQ